MNSLAVMPARAAASCSSFAPSGDSTNFMWTVFRRAVPMAHIYGPVGWASLKGADVTSGQALACPVCLSFVREVGGLHGRAFRAGRRHFYVVSGPLRGSRCGPRYSVPPDFFLDVCEACKRWIVHLAEDVEGQGESPTEHLERQHLVAWIPSLIAGVDFRKATGRDAAVRVCAALLDVSPATIYAKTGRG